MSSKFYSAQRTAHSWVVGGGAALAVGVALVSVVVAQPRAAQPVVLPIAVTAPAPTVAPFEADAAEESQEDRMLGYAIVDGQVMLRVSSGDSAAATSRLVALEDGYYDDGPQGYYWRLRPGR